MSENPSEVLKYFPEIINSLDTIEKVFGLFLLVTPFFIYFMTKAAPPVWRAITSIVVFLVIASLLFLLMIPKAERLKEELPVEPKDSIPDIQPQTLEFLIPHSSQQILTSEEIARLSASQLRIARNEIFARNGRFFQNKELREFFESKPWYSPTTWEPQLNEIELINVALIQDAERKR